MAPVSAEDHGVGIEFGESYIAGFRAACALAAAPQDLAYVFSPDANHGRLYLLTTHTPSFDALRWLLRGRDRTKIFPL
jgi:hypothetical protein